MSNIISQWDNAASLYTESQELDIEAYSKGDMSSADYKSEIWVPIKK
ncbi:MAG: hypothetical protein RSB67_02365 [Clostridia bacterium]